MSPFEKLQKAAALKYNESSDSAPVVVASGMGETARQIVSLAEKSGVPVFRDDSLAALLSRLDTGTQIPPELYRAIVDIYVYFLDFHTDSSGSAAKRDEPKEKSPPSSGKI